MVVIVGKNIIAKINQIFFEKSRVRQNIETIIFLGGSQGAKAINDFALEVAKTKKYKINHQTGKRDYKSSSPKEFEVVL